MCLPRRACLRRSQRCGGSWGRSRSACLPPFALWPENTQVRISQGTRVHLSSIQSHRHGFIFLHIWNFKLWIASYLELLPSDGLHVALLANGEFVGDLGVCGVDLCPGEVIAALGDLRDQLVVTALLNDVSGDTLSGKRGV